MNKNLLRTGIGLVVGGSLLVTSTVMGMAASGTSGYDTLKVAVKNMKNIENATFSMSGTFSDNNKELAEASFNFKASKEDIFSGEIALSSEKVNKSYALYQSEDSIVFKDAASDVYNKVEYSGELKAKGKKMRKYHSKEIQNPQMEMLGEKILDTLVGDLKKQVTQESIGNSEKKISIDLDKSEIPALVNLVLAAKSEKTRGQSCDKSEMMHEIFGVNPADCKLPELKSNIQAEKIDVDIVVDKNNMIKELDMEFDISGNDSQNKFHEQELKISMDVSDINSTKVDSIDLSGKEVKEISYKELGCSTED